MEEMNTELLSLKKSPLYEYRTQNGYLPVVGDGDCSAKIMFIGEAPGKNEAKTGKPFCGTAGKILDKLLNSIDLERKDVFITNIVKDRPPENRDPSLEEIDIYGPFLDKQIEVIQPKIIATLGRYSMNYVLEKFGLKEKLLPIGEIHGKFFDSNTTYGSVKVVVLYHPCVAVYNGSKIGILMEDFKIIKKLLDK